MPMYFGNEYVEIHVTHKDWFKVNIYFVGSPARLCHLQYLL